MNASLSSPSIQPALFQPRSGLAMLCLAMVYVIAVSSMATPAFSQESIEKVVSELGERFQISSTADGWQLRPSHKPGKFQSIEVSPHRITVDGGEPVNETDLYRFVSSDDAERLFYLATGGRYVDSVSLPPAQHGPLPSVSAPANPRADLPRRVRSLLSESFERSLPGEENRAALERLRRVESIGDLRREIEHGTCRLEGYKEPPPEKNPVGEDRGSLEIALCSNLSIGPGEDSASVLAIGGDLLVMGTVRGDATIAVGNAVVEGTVEGDLVVVGGSIVLRSGAIIYGDVLAVSGAVDIRPGSTIQGEVFHLDLREVMQGSTLEPDRPD